MSTTTTIATGDTGEDQQPEDQHQDTDGAEGEEDAEARRGREKRLRVERREAVEERNALRQQVTTLQRAEATRLAGEVLADADDLWSLGGAEVADLLDEDGAVSAERVREAAEAVVTARGERFRRPRPRVDYDGGTRQTARAPQRTGWAAVLNPDDHARTRGAR